jgi:ABC-type transport system involved in cytochrome c biogenesis permease subunit
MNKTTTRYSRWAAVLALVAIAFGIVTIFVGGKTLFGGAEVRAAAGNIVPFVLWFNFVAGFAYVIAGLGLFWWKRWAAQLSAAIAVATMAVFFAFGIHILLGGMFEGRTVGAMTIRSAVWIAIAASACRTLGCFRRGTSGSAQ